MVAGRVGTVVVVGLLCALLASLLSCAPAENNEQGEVVLYSSADDYLLREVVQLFETTTGVRVRLVGDTEATRTTGLMQRLLAEKDRPRADVWWSGEAFSTIRLAREGVLEPYTSSAAEQAFADEEPSGWPAHLRGADDTWYGFALRARVLAYSTARVDGLERPRNLADLTRSRWRDRVGIARPQFGTTRGHMAALLHEWGPDRFESWLREMRDNGVRLYDGNATAVRAIAMGEIDICLTDTDDVWVAQRNGWEVGIIYEDDNGDARYPSFGPLMMPNTVAVVRGGPNPDNARRLVGFLLGPSAERLIAESDSRNIPVNPSLRGDYPDFEIEHGAFLDNEAIADRIEEAMDICERVLGSG